ncbi:MAG: SPOR domain-containing protein, partial [Synergistaceae bacterium]|nr:SPOR domain-containing protein [Synergistaceae bacterium]
EKIGGDIVLAGPLTARGTPAMPSGKTNTASTTTQRPAAAKTSAPATNARTTQPAASPPANTATAANSKWGVQIGAFVNGNSATTLVSEVKKQGYTASVSRADSSGKTFHRVRVNAGGTREDANRLAAELERKGYPVSVVPMQ